MAGKVLLPVLLFTSFLSLFAQAEPMEKTDTDVSYYIEQTDTDIRFIQRLSWGRDENDYRYEVIIEKAEDGGRWFQVLRESCKDNYIEVSLRPGNYRYRVTVYNLLNQAEYTMNPFPFRIIPALEPVIVSVNPDRFYLDEDSQWVIVIHGKDFAEGAEFFLLHKNKKIIPGGTEINAEGTSVRLVFAKKDLAPGSYTVNIKNPGGLTGAWEYFNIAYSKPWDLNLSAGYAPLFPLYGELNKRLDYTPMPLGFIARISFVPFKYHWGFLGAEFAPSWNYLKAPFDDRKFHSHITSLEMHGLYQYWFFPRTLALNFRLGAGYSAFANMRIEGDEPKTDPGNVPGGSNNKPESSTQKFSGMFSADTGVSVQWFFYKSLFLEAGADYIHFFTVDNAHPGYLRLALTAGWQF